MKQWRSHDGKTLLQAKSRILFDAVHGRRYQCCRYALRDVNWYQQNLSVKASMNMMNRMI